MTWTAKPFDELTPYELYAIMQLRNEIFVVEQNCVFQDADNKDQASHHVMGWDAGTLLAYARIVPAGISYVESSIGRIVSSREARGRGIGRDLVERSIHLSYSLHGKDSIRIGAQYYLKRFYESFGFRQTGAVYIEDGIEHIIMLLPAPH
jgi:ElaA protein